MKLMRIVIYMRMIEWIEGVELTHIDVRDEDGGVQVQMAIIEQDKIGWDHFFKGVSKQRMANDSGPRIREIKTTRRGDTQL